LPKKNKNKLLTFGQISAIIEEQIKKVKEAPDKTWGFTRTEIIGILRQTLKDIEDVK
tara:strand:- start:15 stop:185 length:171 start_codon:yes stop_codon:yes gene_type:complete